MSSSILRVKDKNGNWISIPAIRGDTPYIKNGTWWIGEEDTGVIVGGAMVATGSYVGTGTSGPANPITLTFDFEPKFLMVSHTVSGTTNDFLGIFIKGRSTSINFKQTSDSTDENYVGVNVTGSTVTFLDNSVSFYNGTGSYSFPAPQFNCVNITYYYVAIG